MPLQKAPGYNPILFSSADYVERKPAIEAVLSMFKEKVTPLQAMENDAVATDSKPYTRSDIAHRSLNAALIAAIQAIADDSLKP